MTVSGTISLKLDTASNSVLKPVSSEEEEEEEELEEARIRGSGGRERNASFGEADRASSLSFPSWREEEEEEEAEERVEEGGDRKESDIFFFFSFRS